MHRFSAAGRRAAAHRLGIGKTGLETIFSGNYQTLAAPGPIALAAAIVSIAGKEAMYWYTRHYALLIHSSAFMADAWHHRSDAFSSIGSLIGIAGAMLGFPVLDSVASVVICLFILKVSYDILKDAINKLLGTSCGEEYEQKLRTYVAARPGGRVIPCLAIDSGGRLCPTKTARPSRPGCFSFARPACCTEPEQKYSIRHILYYITICIFY